MSEKKLHKALVAVCGEVGNVKRDTVGQVGHNKYKYATIDAVLEVLQPLLKKNGLALVQYVRGDNLIAELHHEGGEIWSMGEYFLGGFIDSQKRGSAITYGRRYQLCSIFGIAQEDDDGAKASEPKQKASAPTSGELTAQTEFGTAVKFKEYFADTQKYIQAMISKDQAVAINKRIARVAKVDEQCADQLADELSLKLDQLHLQG
jgi:ERF superfamily